MQTMATQRYKELTARFPQLQPTIDKLNAADIPFVLGGSASLYLQGNDRKPHDIDLLFLPEAHERCNQVFGLQMEYVERPTVHMQKSTPVSDNSIDFLSKFTMIAEGRDFHMPPAQKVTIAVGDGGTIHLEPIEKLVIVKLLGRRAHHGDFEDVRNALTTLPIDKQFFWQLVHDIDAKEVIERLLQKSGAQV